MLVIGFAGWSGAGKTTLIAGLVPEFARRGVSVSTLKHTHHAIEPDAPGKDSFVHRAAGARETLLASPERLSLVRELRGAAAPGLGDLLRMFAPVDLVLVEGFRRAPFAKIEVVRAAQGKPPLWPDDPHIVALVSDRDDGAAHLPHARIDDIPGVASLVLSHAQALDAALRGLDD